MLTPRLAADLPLEVCTGEALEVMAAADLCLTSSGTTTLEIAGGGVPFVLGYRVSPVLYMLGRLLISVEHIGLVNLVAGRTLVPEHVGVRSFAIPAARDLNRLWTDKEARDEQLRGLADVREKLGGKESYRKTAQAILGFLDGRSQVSATAAAGPDSR